MAGLLQKDLYLIVKYCKAYILIAAVFLAASLFSDGNLFFLFYPCVLAGMIPITLMSYDERSHWNQLACTLPFSRAQIVSAKYLVGLCAQLLVLILTGVFQVFRAQMTGTVDLGDFSRLLMGLFAVSQVVPSVYLPIMFKWGVEKARIFYYVIIGFTFAVTASLRFLTNALSFQVSTDGILWILCFGEIALYGLSWLLSIALYQKREIL